MTEWLGTENGIDTDAFDDLVDMTSVYPGTGTIEGLTYVTMGLVGETGEIANQVKKIIRDDDSELTEDRRLEILDELGDVLWYVFALATELDMPIETIMSHTSAKLKTRLLKNTIHGDKR